MRKRIDPVKVFLNVIIVVLCIIFTVLSSQAWEETYYRNDYHKRDYQADDYEFYLREQNYVKMYEMARKNEICDDTVYVDVSEFEAIGRYFEQAFHYRMYRELKDSQKAARYELGMKMEAENVRMAILQSEIEKINEILLK